MKKILVTIFILIILGGILSFFYIRWQIFRPLNDDGTLHDFIIREGQGVKEIGQGLSDKSMIRGSWYFEVYVWYKRREADFQAGNFKVSSSMNIPAIVAILIGEPEPREVEITIIEGWDRREIDAYLANLELIRAGDFVAGTQNFEASILGGHYEAGQNASLEGFLFPDTYRIYKDTDLDEILEKMFANFQKKVNPLLPEIENQGKNLYEILSMASIVEKESASREEMPIIAGVFYNRLQDEYFLESDATVNYVTGKGARRPSLEDLEADSPYNTYLNRGLPPGPICNPGLAAIRAAINPEDTDYYYFLHPEEGGTIFSKTLKEHNENKARYLK